MRRSPSPERVLATVLFTDIVGSTELASRLGDRRWEELKRRHHAIVRDALKRFRGREMDTAGDGFFAIFDRPAQAIGCAVAIQQPLRSIGIEIRAGIHAGEVELGREKAGGIAVHTGARVLAAAQPGEIVVTSTVKDLVAGSDIEFEDRGVSLLKGIPGERRLYAVAVAAEAPAEPLGPPSEAADRSAAERRRFSVPLWLVPGLAGLGVIGVAAAAILPSILAAPVVPGANTVGRIPAGGAAFDLALRVGLRPTALAIGEGAVWVVNFRDQTLSRINTSTGAVEANPAVGGAPTGLAVGGGAVWVTTAFGTAGGDTGSLMRFNPSNAEREGTVPLGSGVAAVAFGDGAVWVADRLGDRVLKIDPRTNAVEEIPVGRAPGAVAVGQGSAWVTSTLDSSVWRVDAVDPFEVRARIPLSAAPTAIAVAEDGVWVTSQQGDTLTRIDPRGNTIVMSVPVGDGPTGVGTAGYVWVALANAGEVVMVDAASGSIAARFAVDGAPDGVVVDQTGAVWVSVHEP
jgi:class 3 adenylate cyclase/DNA-binding beta-propeller fold protein YncE